LSDICVPGGNQSGIITGDESAGGGLGKIAGMVFGSGASVHLPAGG